MIMVTYHPRPANKPPARRLDASRPWGNSAITQISARYNGRATLRLTVLRPGTTRRDRVAVHLFVSLIHREQWLLVAVGSLVVAGFLTQGLWGAVIGAAVGTAAVVLGSWILASRSLADAQGIRITFRRGEEPDTAHMELYDRFYTQLLRLDSADLTPAQYEVKWAEIYHQLASEPAAGAHAERGETL